MPTQVHRFMLAGIESEVPLARHEIVDKVRAWGVPLDEETADAVRLVASELITNAVVHGAGPITVTLSAPACWSAPERWARRTPSSMRGVWAMARPGG